MNKNATAELLNTLRYITDRFIDPDHPLHYSLVLIFLILLIIFTFWFCNFWWPAHIETPKYEKYGLPLKVEWGTCYIFVSDNWVQCRTYKSFLECEDSKEKGYVKNCSMIDKYD